MSEDFVLVPEVEVRHALRDRPLRLRVLAPYGAWLGCGALRVLRLKSAEDQLTELIVGYDRYEPLADAPERT